MILEAMNTLQIKQRIHEFIDHADERFLRLVFSMVESEEAENELFSTSDDEMITRTKKSLESIEKGNTRNIHALKKDVDSWKKKQSTQLR
jgi:hypothetical protein